MPSFNLSVYVSEDNTKTYLDNQDKIKETVKEVVKKLIEELKVK